MRWDAVKGPRPDVNWTHCCSVCTLTSRPPGRPITEQFNEYNNERIVLWPSYQILISTPMADFGMIKCQTIIKTLNVGASFEKLVFIPPLEYQELENPTSSSAEDVVTACGSQKLYFDILYLPPNRKSKSSHVTLKHKSCLLLFKPLYTVLWVYCGGGGRQTGAWHGRKTERERLKKNYKAMALSGPTIWGHLDARLVADWPPALTHSAMPTYSTTFQFCCRSQLFGIAVGEKEQICPFRPCLSLTLWFEYRSLNWIPGARPLHSYSASSSPLPFSPSLLLFTFLHPAYSPSSLFPLCPSPSLLLWNTGGHFLFFFFSPPACF